MLDSHGRAEIQRLRSEIRKLKRGRPFGKRWRAWYNDACTVLRNLYGLESSEFRDFQAIRFEIGLPLANAEEKLREALQAELPLPFPGLKIPGDHHFRERLSEADDYLLSLISSNV